VKESSWKEEEMRRLALLAVCAALLALFGSNAVSSEAADAAAEEAFPDLSKRVPYLTQRLQSTRWQVRYYLLLDLKGRDSQTKRAQETLVRDEHEGVANQATVRYVNNFVNIKKTLFRPGLYAPGRFPIADLPEDDPDRALVDYCLARSEIPRRPRDDMRPVLPVLDPAQSDNPRMHETLTIVGILGRPEDARALYPFLQSTNDYVAFGAAKAVIRLGDKSKGVEALCRLAGKDPSEHLYYVTEALHALREMDHPDLKSMALRILSSVDRTEGIQPNWLGEFLLLAADVVGNDVWKAADSVRSTTEADKPEILKHYHGDVEIPEELLETYEKLIAAFAKGEAGAINALSLPSSLTFTYDPRPKESKAHGGDSVYYGQDTNIPFLKSKFDRYIRVADERGEGCCLLRTVTTAMWFVETKQSGWRLYRYLDKPIE